MELRDLPALLRIFGEHAFAGVFHFLKRSVFLAERRPCSDHRWWEGPGIGVMYQIEYRPGMDWDRNFDDFNQSMRSDDGSLMFNGPFCRVKEWVALSKMIGVDYHIFETKWHDGICYFDTALTNWKTPVDYAGIFALESKEEGIPFLYYYSAVFDHNPMFDDIQPHPDRTASFLGNEKRYIDYALAQIEELLEKYAPDGMWIDWCWPDLLTGEIVKMFQLRYPDKILTFNASNYLPWSYKRLTYTSGEAHDLTGPYVRVFKIDGRTAFAFSSAWKWSNLNRRTLEQPWELVGPAGKWWQDPSLRDDPLDLLRMAAVIMSCGGKFCIGATAKLDGDIYADQVKQLEMLGEWYIPRKKYFRASVPLKYRTIEPDFVAVSGPVFRKVAARADGDVLIHLINMKGLSVDLRVEVSLSQLNKFSRVRIAPSDESLDVERSVNGIIVKIPKAMVDPVDTILVLKDALNR